MHTPTQRTLFANSCIQLFRNIVLGGLAMLATCVAAASAEAPPSVEVRQLTHGPKHHFCGYIGHVRTIPWNESGRYIVALETDFQDHMPRPDEAASIVLIDTHNENKIRVVDQTRAWNFQQGTMLYWNPRHPETQFFFNDRDLATNRIYTVLFDISADGSANSLGKRIAEYRYDDASLGNSGVAQLGGSFLALNYGRLARLRPVTGYPGAIDLTLDERTGRPNDDGVFLVDIATKRKTLLVSFAQLYEQLKTVRPDANGKPLFINHTLWSRNDRRIFFYVRADFEKPEGERINVPFVIRPDGTGLTMLDHHLGGHPEWLDDVRMIGSRDDRQVVYDVEQRKFVETLGTPAVFPEPGGDKALSPTEDWLVNGYRLKGSNFYTLYRFRDGANMRSPGFDQFGWTKGELRVDAAPCWNRDGTQILFPSLAPDGKSRQLFVLTRKP